MTTPILKYKKIIETAKAPTRNLKSDAGYDLYCCEDMILYPMDRANIPLGIAIELPFGYSADIRPRSSSNSQGLHVYFGLIDSGYRGPLFAFVQNLSNKLICIDAGDRVCQLVIHPVLEFEIEEVKELSKSDRNTNGFGSSGR